MPENEKVRYRVTGKRRIRGVKPGDTLELDPKAGQTRRLLKAKHIEAAPVEAKGGKKGGDA